MDAHGDLVAGRLVVGGRHRLDVGELSVLRDRELEVRVLARGRGHRAHALHVPDTAAIGELEFVAGGVAGEPLVQQRLVVGRGRAGCGQIEQRGLECRILVQQYVTEAPQRAGGEQLGRAIVLPVAGEPLRSLGDEHHAELASEAEALQFGHQFQQRRVVLPALGAQARFTLELGGGLPEPAQIADRGSLRQQLSRFRGARGECEAHAGSRERAGHRREAGFAPLRDQDVANAGRRGLRRDERPLQPARLVEQAARAGGAGHAFEPQPLDDEHRAIAVEHHDVRAEVSRCAVRRHRGRGELNQASELALGLAQELDVVEADGEVSVAEVHDRGKRLHRAVEHRRGKVLHRRRVDAAEIADGEAFRVPRHTSDAAEFRAVGQAELDVLRVDVVRQVRRFGGSVRVRQGREPCAHPAQGGAGAGLGYRAAR